MLMGGEKAITIGMIALWQLWQPEGESHPEGQSSCR